jgi:hypothetical protein
MNDEQLVFEEVLLRHPPPLRIKHARIAIEKIDFDPTNPRLRYLKELYPDKTSLQLIFENESDTAYLKKDIKEKGVIDPIYVVEDGKRYRVIEGNRRTACVLELHREEPESVMFFTMPARVLPDSIADDQTALLMASFHVAGKVKWAPHEKAGHIYHMLKVLHIPEAEMSNTLHMGVPAIKRSAESFAILEEVYKRIDGGKYADKAAGKWSFFDQMLRLKPLREKHKDNPEWAAEFCRWVGEGRIPRAEDVRYLPDILSKAKARHYFENEKADEAFAKAKAEADTSKPGNRSKLFKQLEKVLAIVKDGRLGDLDLAQNNDAARTLITETYQALGSFMERANVRVPGPRRVA